MRFAAAFAGITAAVITGIILGRTPAVLTAQVPPAAAPAPATPDYYPLNSRTIKLPIKYEKDRKSIRQVMLYVARNGENTWYQEGAVPPDRDSFTYIAKEDGLYWFTMVIEDLQGRKDPADLTRTAPDLKVVVDTLPPRVQFTNTKRNGDEVVAEWMVDDKHPDDNNTKFHFRPAGSEGFWQEVTLPAGSKSGVRFAAGTASPIVVRVTAIDIAGNKTESTREIAAAGSSANTTSTSLSATIPPTASIPITPASANTPPGSGAPIPPPESLAPAPPSTPITPAAPVAPSVAPSITPATPPSTAPIASPPAAVPTTDPRQTPTTAVQPPTPNAARPTPVAVWSGGPAGAAPTVEVSRSQAINYLAFDMGYEVESRGPSGISRVDLWVTRDDGRTWMKWSQHDGKGSSVRVNLGVPGNPQAEGGYGFRVVPVSGAGLSEREPASGDAPDLRVVVDVTPPQLDLFPPVGDPSSTDTLVIQWKASDRNFGEEPILIEWSDKPTGPWQSVSQGNDGVQLAGTAPTQAKKLANTGSFSWRVPPGLPPKVFLRVTASDAAGNHKEIVTRDAILVDLVKPRAKISGIVGPAVSPRP